MSQPRNYATEMRALIDAEADPEQGPYAPRVVAGKLIARLRESDPELLMGWLDEQAENILWRAILDRDRSTRTYQRYAGRRSAFGQSAERFAAGDATAMSGWLAIPFTVDGGMRKSLGQLTAEDLQFVADGYAHRAKDNAFESAFFRALARQVGASTVADTFTDEQIEDLRSSIAEMKTGVSDRVA